ncbi:hypothetical protein LPJ66_000535 [Kickxella alabastrina]|uniref:Uncharacterized protein n=1 Tax=Kickxella alabastrina TaxID=61397 RepID=A0ACC1IVR2_9FUNG|nr:hypothetical protein LPJ66_000535 [Kickxella alabastrina]
MVLLSILLVVSGFAIFITVYYYRTVIVWVNDPRTTDEEAQNPRARNAHKFSWTFLKSRRRARSDAQPQSRPPSLLPTYSSYHRHLEVQHQYQQSQNLEAPDMQRPWLSMRGKNPRAWRQMRANERLHHQWGGALQRDSSMSSTSLNNMSLPFGPVEPGAPRRPPQTGRHQKVPGTPAPL